MARLVRLRPYRNFRLQAIQKMNDSAREKGPLKDGIEWGDFEKPKRL